MNIALLGLPRAGRRTLFFLLTGRQVPDIRKPGEALTGRAPIRDPRVDVLHGLCQPERKVYAENQFVLCPDVAEGDASRHWLEAARKCDLLCPVARGFTDPAVHHPRGSVDAVRDADFIRGELLLADMERVEKRLERLAKDRRAGGTPQQAAEEKVLQKCRQAMDAGSPLRQAALTEEDLGSVRQLELLTLAPLLTVFNVDEEAVAHDAGPGTVTVSARIEQEIMAMDDARERQEYLAAIGLKAPGLDRVNAAAYDALGLMSFYTIGKDEVRAWTIRKGARAPEAAGRIHTDIGRGFIRAEVMKYDDFVAAGSEAAVRHAGKMQTRGRDYVIEDGDICHFLFNV